MRTTKFDELLLKIFSSRINWGDLKITELETAQELCAFLKAFPGLVSKQQHDVVRRVFNGIGEDHEPAKVGYYPSIRYGIGEFVEIFGPDGPSLDFDDKGSRRWTQREGKSFLDIGSCNGEKVWCAKHFGRFKKAAGIELSKKSFDIATKFNPEGTFYNQDAFESGDIIGQHDTIYMFHPIMDDKLMAELYLFVMKNMPIGGILLEVLPSDFWRKIFGYCGAPILLKRVAENKYFTTRLRRSKQSEPEEILKIQLDGDGNCVKLSAQ